LLGRVIFPSTPVSNPVNTKAVRSGQTSCKLSSKSAFCPIASSGPKTAENRSVLNCYDKLAERDRAKAKELRDNKPPSSRLRPEAGQ
jgi:hypothetical protein